MRTLRVPALLLLAVLALGACGGSEATPAPSPEPAASSPASAVPSTAAGACEVADTADGTSVRIAGFAFAPATVTIKVGETVTWTNEDTAGHTATMADGCGRTGTIQKGQSASIRFDAPGDYPYTCSIHPRMTGSVVVEP
jgi:plastocyanin